MSSVPAPTFSRYGPVLRFLGTVTVVYGMWYVLYDLWLLPDGRLDRWVSLSVVQVSEGLLSLAGLDAAAAGRHLSLSDAPGIRIVDGCNGLASMGLFVGFVLAYPGQAWRRALFVPLGILAVYLSNVGRVSGLLLLQQHWSAGFDAAHSVGAPLFFYTVIFGLWVLWANYGGSEGSSSDASEHTRRAFA